MSVRAKFRRLRRLAAQGEGNEAANARSAMAKLRHRHPTELADLGDEDEPIEKTRIEFTDSHMFSAFFMICIHFDCKFDVTLDGKFGIVEGDRSAVAKVEEAVAATKESLRDLIMSITVGYTLGRYPCDVSEFEKMASRSIERAAGDGEANSAILEQVKRLKSGDSFRGFNANSEAMNFGSACGMRERIRQRGRSIREGTK